MTLDEANDLRVRAGVIHSALSEFLPLFRKKHEKWTALAYDKALDDLRELHHDLFKRLFEVDEVQKELGDDPLVNVVHGTMHPRNGGGR
jgi:hypothetical protein